MEISQVALSILTSIITGGFVLVFVEIGNRKNRENDRYDQIMFPFMHKLSAYLRFMSWSRSHIIYNTPQVGYEKEIKPLIEEMSRLGGRIITAGGDYGIGYFSAKEMEQIASNINNIWYWHDKMNPCPMSWNNNTYSADLIAKELKEINPIYLQDTQNVDLVAKVSGDFFVDVYQPIEGEIFRHEAYQQHYNRQTMVLVFFSFFVLTILSLLLFNAISAILLQIATLVVILMLAASLMMLAINMRKQIKCWKITCEFFSKKLSTNIFRR